MFHSKLVVYSQGKIEKTCKKWLDSADFSHQVSQIYQTQQIVLRKSLIDSMAFAAKYMAGFNSKKETQPDPMFRHPRISFFVTCIHEISPV